MRPRPTFRRWLPAAAVVGLLALHGPTARAAAIEPPDATVALPADVAAAVDDGPVEVLVSFDPSATTARVRHDADGSPTPQSVAAVAAGLTSLKDRALDAAGSDARVVEDFDHLPVQKVRVESREALDELAADPAVTGISTTRTFRLAASPNLELIGQPAAVASGLTGAGSVVAVLDSGVSLAGTGGLFGNCAGGPGTGTCRIDFHENLADPTFVDVDPERHGTNVAAVVATVAPQAHLRIYGVFVEDGGDIVTDTDIVLAALNHLAAHAPAGAVQAVNLSLGDPLSRTNAECTSSPFNAAFAQLRALGIVPVVAAGNGAYANGPFQPGLSEPACAPGALRVGAVYSQAVPGAVLWGGPTVPQCTDIGPAARQITCFTQSGPLLSLLAPGVAVSAGGVTLSGTSQAAPHVAGAVALLHQADPGLSADQAAAILKASGPVVSDGRTSPATQRPVLDIPEAVRRATPAAITRLQGPDRIATALATSAASFPGADSADAVVLASSESYPDGLAGTPLAVAEDAPLLLTTSAALRSDVLAEVQRVLAPGRTVFVLGGPASISPAVATTLVDAGFPVERIAGEDRFATATAIADALGSPTQVFLATGRNFPDALAAGVAAAHVGGAVLFTEGTAPAPATATWLAAHPSLPRTIVGGSAAGASPGAAEVLGANRYETATNLAVRVWGNGPVGPLVAIASGAAFPDALSGGAHVARLGGPILLTPPDGLPQVVRAWLAARSATLERVFVYGGTATVGPVVEDAVRTATD